MKTKTPKTPQITAQKFWKSASGSYLYPDKKSAQYFSGFEAPKVKPVVVLPADSASYTAMIAQIKKAWIDADESKHMDEMACITLSALGIKPSK